jgi:hypothetical protein
MPYSNKTDFKNTIIYKIQHKDYDSSGCDISGIYVGHSTNFIRRYASHRHAYYNSNHKNHNCKVYHYIRDNGGWENFIIIKLEDYPCENKNQASIREKYWIEECNAFLNERIPSRTPKEYFKWYCKEYKDVIAQKQKVYYQNNKDKILEKKRLYYQNNKDKLKQKYLEKKQKNNELLRENNNL